MNFPRLILGLMSFGILQSAAFAGTTEAEQRLQTVVSEVLKVAEKATDTKKMAADLRPLLIQYISFDAMTRRAVGPGWRQFTPDEQKQATGLFTTLIIRTYSSKFTPGEHPEVKFKAATEPAPGRVEIPTTLLYQGSRYSVIYRLEESSGWKITDIVAEGVSFIANYRSQFDAEFKKNGPAGVIAALNQAVGDLK